MEKTIVKIDRSTAQEWLPVTMHRGIFTSCNNLPSKHWILEMEKKSLDVEKLTLGQERKALSGVGVYRTDKHVIRDYHDYCIGFNLALYQGVLDDVEKSIEGKLSSDRCEKKRAETALQKIHLYKLGHKIAMIILSEAYRQRKYEDLTITKETILSYLGHRSSDKRIYRQIDEAMFSLKWLDYVIYHYKTEKGLRLKNIKMGNFIYNMKSDKKSYVVDINKAFLGCIVHVLSEETKELSESDKRCALERGYYSYPTDTLSKTRDYSTHAYLLTHFLILDSGNSKLSDAEHKVIAYAASGFMKRANINNIRVSKRKNDLIKALLEIEIIEKIEPGIEQLKRIKPSRFDDVQIRIYIKK